MATQKKITDGTEPSIDADRVMQDLAKIAFANMADFARFGDDGQIHIFDYEKAREVGAKVSVVTRTVGRGKNAREVRRTSIKMPNKVRALILLGKRLGLFKTRRTRK
jgi:phage terminase small subunit